MYYHAHIWACYPRIWGVTEGYGLSPRVADLEVRIKNCIKIELACYGGTCLYDLVPPIFSDGQIPKLPLILKFDNELTETFKVRLL